MYAPPCVLLFLFLSGQLELKSEIQQYEAALQLASMGIAPSHLDDGTIYRIRITDGVPLQPVVRIIPSLPGLKVIDFRDFGDDKKRLKPFYLSLLTPFEQIRELHFANAVLHDNDLQALTRLKGLRYLQFYGIESIR